MLASISNLVVSVVVSVVVFTNSSNELDEFDVEARELLNARSAALCIRPKREFRDDSDGDDTPYGSSRVSSFSSSLCEAARTHRREHRLDASLPIDDDVIATLLFGRRSQPPRRKTDDTDARALDPIATRFDVPRAGARITDSYAIV